MPLLRARLDEKFARGAENQALLVEAVTGIQTVKAMALEPQMQRRWDEQLAGLCRRPSFRVARRSATTPRRRSAWSASSSTAAMLWFGASLVIERRAHGRPVRRLQHVGRPRRAADHAHRAAVAGLPADRHLDRAARRHPEHAAPRCRRRRPRRSCRRSRAAIRFDHVTFRYRPDGPEVLHGVEHRHSRRRGDRHRRPLRLGQEHADQAGAAPVRARAGPRAGRRHRHPPDRRRPSCAARSAWCCRRTCCSTAACARTSRSPTPPRRSRP